MTKAGILTYGYTRIASKTLEAVLEAQMPLFGVGGAGVFEDAVLQRIESFREWDHYLMPIGSVPKHRFWTWGKMDRKEDTPAGACLSGVGTSKAWMDSVFACDTPRIDAVLAKYSGGWHGVGNEPNYYPVLAPADYAYQLHLYVDYIKSRDPLAQIMLGGPVVSAWYVTTPTWDVWLDAVIAAYIAAYGGTFPVDIWDIHPYDSGWPNGYTAANLSIQNIVNFRAYLNARALSGYIVIGEFSDAGLGSTAAVLVQYITVICPWLRNNCVPYNIIAWYWWGVHTPSMGTTGLFSASPYSYATMTKVGAAYLFEAGGSASTNYPMYRRLGVGGGLNAKKTPLPGFPKAANIKSVAGTKAPNKTSRG